MMKNFFKNILDFIFPIECAGCGAELFSGSDPLQRGQTPCAASWLCDYCFSKIEYNKKQVCPLCGRETETGYSCVCTVGVGFESREGKEGREEQEGCRDGALPRLEEGEEEDGAIVLKSEERGIEAVAPKMLDGDGTKQIGCNPKSFDGAGSHRPRSSGSGLLHPLPNSSKGTIEPSQKSKTCLKSKISYVDVYVTFVDLKKNPQVAKLIHKLKYEFVEDAAKDLARIGVEFIKRNNVWEKLGMAREGGEESSKFKIQSSKLGGEDDVLFVPIPLHRKRLLWRGFNQSELILRGMGERIKKYELVIKNEEKEEQKLEKKPVLSLSKDWKLEIMDDILIRKKNTLFQGKSRMNEADRTENMRGVFEVPPLIPPCKGGKNKKTLIKGLTPPSVNTADKCLLRPSRKEGESDSYNFLKGKTIVLFDDVITTGATVEECARVLKEAGAARVIAMAVGKG